MASAGKSARGIPKIIAFRSITKVERSTGVDRANAEPLPDRGPAARSRRRPRRAGAAAARRIMTSAIGERAQRRQVDRGDAERSRAGRPPAPARPATSPGRRSDSGRGRAGGSECRLTPGCWRCAPAPRYSRTPRPRPPPRRSPPTGGDPVAASNAAPRRRPPPRAAPPGSAGGGRGRPPPRPPQAIRAGAARAPRRRRGRRPVTSSSSTNTWNGTATATSSVGGRGDQVATHSRR